MESSGRGGSSSESKSRRSSAAQGSRRKGCTGSTTSNEVVRQHLTGVAGGGEYYPHIRHSKRISMAPHDAMQRRLAAIAAATSGSTSTALPMPYIPTVDDVAARRGSSSSTGTQERVVCWTDITRAEDEDMDLDTVDDGKIEDLDSEGQELPEILHLIFNALVHLTPPEDFSQRDLLQCLMVCKQWYVVGQKTLWRDIRFREPEQLHRFISFLQSTLPPRMPEADDQSQAEDDALRMPGAWGVEPVERLGIENGQSRRSVDVRMRMDGFDGQDEEEEEEEEEEADVIMSEASEASPYHQLVRETVDNSTLSFTSPKAVEQRILDRASAVKKIVLHKFKTLTDVEVLPLTTWFPNLTSIEFYICELLTDAVVISLAEHCPRLQFLLLPGCAKVTDEGIKAVARNCPRLRHLDLRACSLVSDDSLIEIAAHCPDLWHLNCGRVTGAHRVTGKSIVPIARNTNLNTLGLAGCGMTDEAVIKIAEYCREGLNRISLNCCVELTSASIRALMVFCPNLAVLEIKKCLRIRDMAPLNHFVRQRILVELCPDLQKRLVAYKVELASQQAATAAAAGRASGSAASSAVAGATAASSTTTTLWQESDDATHESQQQNPHSGSNRVQTGGAQAGATVLPSSSQTVPTSSSSAFTNSTTSTTEMNAIMTTTTTTTTTMTTTTTTASTANTTIVTTR
ncbi:Antagonist of MEN (Mitotic Exit Network) [Actinomortierella ambigua]|uniref:Antagonist of MEN (Mitotic Exit Network) n=1 Tax=Actinomortierella ambigua TaxID=1343610 RepID=A0A9P6PZG4_9FUNG|nr:Antagonist of MEN (Mitotic Exit Network) [Actinomortierella ambigua]